MTPKEFSEHLIKLNACEDAHKWAKGKSWHEVYSTCHRGDWLLWLAQKQGIDKRLLTLVGGHCANTVRHLMTDKRSTDAVDIAIAYGEGRATEDELAAANEAARAAWAAMDAALAARYEAAWYEAARAAWAAMEAAWYEAARAAWAAMDAALAAREANQQQTAEIVRKFITIEKFGL